MCCVDSMFEKYDTFSGVANELAWVVCVVHECRWHGYHANMGDMLVGLSSWCKNHGWHP